MVYQVRNMVLADTLLQVRDSVETREVSQEKKNLSVCAESASNVLPTSALTQFATAYLLAPYFSLN